MSDFAPPLIPLIANVRLQVSHRTSAHGRAEPDDEVRVALLGHAVGCNQVDFLSLVVLCIGLQEALLMTYVHFLQHVCFKAQVGCRVDLYVHGSAIASEDELLLRLLSFNRDALTIGDYRVSTLLEHDSAEFPSQL